MQYIVFTSSIWKYYRYATFGKNSRTFRKILVLKIWGKKGKSWGVSPHTAHIHTGWVMGLLKLMSSIAFLTILARACPSFRPKLGHIWSQNILFSIYFKFGSSDFDKTFRKCYWYEINEGRWVWSHGSFLSGHALEFGSLDFA